MSWIACWNTAVIKSLSQCFPQPAVWGRIHSPNAMGARGQQDVDEGQAQDHLHQQVEDEEAEGQVEQGDEHRQPGAGRLHRVQQRVQGRPQQVAGG